MGRTGAVAEHLYSGLPFWNRGGEAGWYRTLPLVMHPGRGTVTALTPEFVVSVASGYAPSARAGILGLLDHPSERPYVAPDHAPDRARRNRGSR